MTEAALKKWVPVATPIGTKWVRTVDVVKRGRWSGCKACHVLAECSLDVSRGDFAWCEEVIVADFTLDEAGGMRHV